MKLINEMEPDYFDRRSNQSNPMCELATVGSLIYRPAVVEELCRQTY